MSESVNLIQPEVLKEDQIRINEFSRLNTMSIELKAEIEAKEVD